MNLLSILSPPEILPGSIWGWQHDKGNPWAEQTMKVLEVRQGFVRFQVYFKEEPSHIIEARAESLFRGSYYLISNPAP
jgi:hypothetical protein